MDPDHLAADKEIFAADKEVFAAGEKSDEELFAADKKEPLAADEEVDRFTELFVKRGRLVGDARPEGASCYLLP